eukprot:11533957-Alexandrium_andersonii.AAC.1
MDLRSPFGTTRIALYSSYKVLLLRARTNLSIRVVPLQAAFVSSFTSSSIGSSKRSITRILMSSLKSNPSLISSLTR